ncbi:MAG: sulfite exporter TauE/SafE family protein, partial [Caldiserica bacterium]|nr:sulfite exporter TauE/SafE family protein [Caldisericota bacterium]
KMPSLSRTPAFIQRQSDYLKTFFLGLFLGNAGVGCPNPITYLILIAAAGSGSLSTGAFYMGVNGLGRVLPLLFFSVLGIVGVNATGALIRKKKLVDNITGWALILIASFIILNGAFGHLWYEGSIVHVGMNRFFASMGGTRLAGRGGDTHSTD